MASWVRGVLWEAGTFPLTFALVQEMSRIYAYVESASGGRRETENSTKYVPKTKRFLARVHVQYV